jgi:hypothetical protein
MAKVLMTIQWPEGQPTLEDLQKLFSLAGDEIDPSFGVIEVDPIDHIFTFLVEEASVTKIQPKANLRIAGPFSNPRIEPFGPPQ